MSDKINGLSRDEMADLIDDVLGGNQTFVLVRVQPLHEGGSLERPIVDILGQGDSDILSEMLHKALMEVEGIPEIEEPLRASA
jgi:hypothetical protein